MRRSESRLEDPVRGAVRRRLALAVLALGIAAAGAAARAQPAPLGGEQRLDGPLVPLANSLACPRVVGHSDGGALVAWTRAELSATRVLARAVRPGGGWAPRQEVDGPPAIVYYLQDAAASAAGFTALWRRAVLEPDGEVRSPHVARPLDRDGAPEGEVLDLARGATTVRAHPDGFVVHWPSGRTLNVQRLDAGGIALAPPVKIKTANPSPHGGDVFVAVSPGGDFAVGWNAFRNGRWLGFWVQRFAADGRLVGTPARLLPPGKGAGIQPRLGLAADGTLALAWTVTHGSLRNPSRAMLRTFDAGNRPLGPAFAAAPSDGAPSQHTYSSSLAVDPAGRTLLVWTQHGPGLYQPRLRARLFDRYAQPLGEAFAVAEPDSPEPYAVCSDAAWAGDSWLVARSAWSLSGDQPETRIAIWARRFAAE